MKSSKQAPCIAGLTIMLTKVVIKFMYKSGHS